MAGSGYSLPENTLLDTKYLIKSVLGKGGFGITYKAVNIKNNEACAIKEFFPKDLVMRMPDGINIQPISTDKLKLFEHGLERFLEEADVLQRLNKLRTVVSVYDFFQQNGTCYFVMEYLEGTTLSSMAKSAGGILPLNVVMDVMKEIGNALIQVHSMNIFHRDISPDNIFITYSGNIKLIDFGNAKNIVRKSDEVLSVVLKPGFAPPEQYSRSGKQGTFTDVYSLAASMYYVLTGTRMPDVFERKTKGYKHLDEYGISESISDAVDRALALKWQDRTQTVEQFMDELGILDRSVIRKTAENQAPNMSTPQINDSVQNSNKQSVNNNPGNNYQQNNDSNDEPVTYRPKNQSGNQPVRNEKVIERQSKFEQVPKTNVPYLEIYLHGQLYKKYKIPINETISIGRVSDMCNIVVANNHISKKHCEIMYDSNSSSFYVMENSSNGTFIREGRLERGKVYQFMPETLIAIGSNECVIKLGVVYE